MMGFGSTVRKFSGDLTKLKGERAPPVKKVNVKLYMDGRVLELEDM